MPTAPTLPPVAGTQNAAIHSASGGPALTDLGLPGAFAGGVITDLKTEFTSTHDTYNDPFMQPMVDVIYGFGLTVTFNMEVHLRGQAAISTTDPGFPTVHHGVLLDEEALNALLTVNDARGFASGSGTGPGTVWPNGTKAIVMDCSGAFERQKLRKDSHQLLFRRYAAA